MHANDIQTHQRLTHEAAELVAAWQGTEPMQSDEAVRRAVLLSADDVEDVELLTLYVIDACRARRLLVEPSSCAVCGREGHSALDLGSMGEVCPENRKRYGDTAFRAMR